MKLTPAQYAHDLPGGPLFGIRDLNLDLDGCYVDFYGRASELIGRPYKEVTGAHAWGIIDKVPHFFRDLDPLPDAMEMLAGVEEFCAQEGNVAPRVLSALPKLTNQLVSAPLDKHTWVRRRMSPRMPVCLVSGGLAKVLFVSPGAILIDDLERNIRAWGAAGGVGILHVNARDTLKQLQRLSRHRSVELDRAA